MALAASPPPLQQLTADQEAQSLQFDDDIAKVRAEIATLTQRRCRLTSALLSSTQVQSRLRRHSALSEDVELTAALDKQSQHTQQSNHRLAFGVTAFPFVDPSPDTSNFPLVGLRFDICKRDGNFDSPYYVLCKRVVDENPELSVHRHTIPALVPLAQYEQVYLPVLDDEGYGSEDSMSAGRQDIEGFARAVRADLVSWRLRQESIELVREKLELRDGRASNDGENVEDEDEEDQATGKCGLKSIEAVAVDARFARIVWEDGRVGRIKIGDDGGIQRAVVIGSVDEEEQRLARDERILVAEASRIDTLVDSLREMDETMVKDD